MTLEDRERWDHKYAAADVPQHAEPDPWLAECLQQISSPGDQPRALDLACGLGANSVWLASQGWQVDAVDISTTGLGHAAGLGDRAGVGVNWIQADLDDWVPRENEYDLVMIFRFLDRESIPRIVDRALRPLGWLVYETFSEHQLRRPDSHIRNPDFTFRLGEVESLFPDVPPVCSRYDELSRHSVVRFLGRRQG